MTDQNKSLTTEREKLGRISERVRTAVRERDQADRAVDALRESLHAEQVDAVLQERPWPTPKAERNLTAVGNNLAIAESALSAARMAEERQQAVVHEIEAAITAGRVDAFRANLPATKARLMAALREFGEAGKELGRLGGAHGIEWDVMCFELFPFDQVKDIFGLFDEERCLLLGYFGTAMRFNNLYANVRARMPGRPGMIKDWK